MKHTREELRQWQSLPLDVKVAMTGARIRAWIHEYCENGVYISFSGGKDSTVLSHLVDRFFPGNEIPRVFLNTGLEYPEVVEFVKKQPRAVLIRPKMNFKQVIEKYGYPFIGKEVAKTVYEGKTEGCRQWRKLNGVGEFSGSYKGMFNMTKWKFLLDEGAPKISHMCCFAMKKRPAHAYEKETGRVAMTGEMAQESRLRTTNWLIHGCNMFDKKRPKSTPMAFWTENDVLQYIKENNIEIASVYGEVVADTTTDMVAKGQMRLEDYIGGQCKYRTTGCNRTGCMFCGFGAHGDKPGEGRFLRMKQTHPKIYEWIMKPTEEGGLGYKEVIDWLNEHGNLHIEY